MSKHNAAFLKDKPHLMSFFVAYTFLILVSAILSELKVANMSGGMWCIESFVSVAMACTLMYFTDKLPINNDFLIGLIDIGDIAVSVFATSTIFNWSNPIGFAFTPTNVVITLLAIVIIYLLTCLVFYIINVKSERQINKRIREMKKQSINDKEQ